ncbi:MAG TPA: hypothetical protein PKE69_25405 [Pyrinomonadaceae bacterium]|nr:hypothetical protein [Pyrinomonadaceae bacterium]
MEVDMSPEAVTQRMEIQNQLWELTVELQREIIIDEKDEQKDDRKEQK